MVAAILAVLALGSALLVLGANLFYLWRWRPVANQASLAPTLILCVTGGGTLPLLFPRLAAQTLRARRLLVVVEAMDDPAVAVVQRLAPTLPYPVEIRCCGTAETRGQKSTALIAAARAIDAADEAVVLLDADILPPPDWLGLLMAPLERGRADVVTGGRWLGLATTGRPAGYWRHLVVWQERNAALGPRLAAFRTIWGGTAGMRAEAFRKLDLPRTLDRALADDLDISRAAEQAGLRVLVRRALLLPTPPEHDESRVAAFEIRQLKLLRLYLPGPWVSLMAVAAAEMAGFPLLLLALAGLAPAWAWAVLAAHALTGAIRAQLYDGVSRRLGQPDPALARLVQFVLGTLRPLGAPLALPILLGSAFGRRVRWRHVEYLVTPEGPRVTYRARPGQEIE